MNNILTLMLWLGISLALSSQPCADPANIVSFTYSGKTYEIVKQNKNWVSAAACAVERGGYLAEIGSAQEQDSLNYFLTLSGITNSLTVAPDGGGASYVWVGGNDLGQEGIWMWDGNNDSSGTQFWQGNYTGSAVGGSYTHWGSSGFGSEPDNYGSGQDGLGLALTNWPLGSAGYWNDISENNSLYFVIEIENSTGATNRGFPETDLQIFPNPAGDILYFSLPTEGATMEKVWIHDLGGRTMYETLLSGTASTSIDVHSMPAGIYLLGTMLSNGEILHRTFEIARW